MKVTLNGWQAAGYRAQLPIEGIMEGNARL
jgi:hypothetical protein